MDSFWNRGRTTSNEVMQSEININILVYISAFISKNKHTNSAITFKCELCQRHGVLLYTRAGRSELNFQQAQNNVA